MMNATIADKVDNKSNDDTAVATYGGSQE